MGADYKREEALTFHGMRGAIRPTDGIDANRRRGEIQEKLQS
jgi:hypothetical protein